MKIALHGATGRMGLALTRLIAQAPDLQLVGAACAPNDPGAGKDVGTLAGVGTLGVEASPDAAAALLGAEVIIDFSNASAVLTIAALAWRNKVALVSGTTGLGAEAKQALEKTAEQVPVLWAPNMSLGVQVLAELVEQALRRLGNDFDAEIVEIHHRKKADSPSGTAKRLADAVRTCDPRCANFTVATAWSAPVRTRKSPCSVCAAATSSATTLFICSAKASASS